jgi:spore coat protein U-like protein
MRKVLARYIPHRNVIVGAALIAIIAPAQASCVVGPLVVATPVLFGLYTAALPSDVDADGTVTVTCVGTMPPLMVSLSSGGSGNFASRSMTAGNGPLHYNLYADSNFSSIWGDGTGNTVKQSYNSGGILALFTVYGQLPTGQFVPSGLYSDTITITVTY